MDLAEHIVHVVISFFLHLRGDYRVGDARPRSKVVVEELGEVLLGDGVGILHIDESVGAPGLIFVAPRFQNLHVFHEVLERNL